MFYEFLGGDDMKQACRELALRKGLAEAGDGQTPTCRVYDLATYSFGEILSELSAAGDGSQPMLGTYNLQTKVLITQKETIR
jgi:hypothetical protein